MLTAALLFDAVSRAAGRVPAVIGMEPCSDPLAVQLLIRDFLADGESEPWALLVRHTDDFVHPLFGDRYACVELRMTLLSISPALPDYLELVAAHAAPCLDHQRFCAGIHTTWDPDSGEIGIYGQLLLLEQSRSSLIAQLRDRIRNVVALVYLTSFRIWQLQLRRRTPDLDAVDRLIEASHRQMLTLLGARPPG